MAKDRLVTEAHLKEALKPHATKHDLEDVRLGLEDKMQSLEDTMDTRFEETVKALMRHSENLYQKIEYRFSDLLDHSYAKLAGANLDHLSIHDDKLKDHEQRIEVLESI